MVEQQGKTALLVGATGLIGSELLTLLLASERYNKVVVFVRRPECLPADNEKLQFFPFEQALPQDIAIDHFYCALGTTQKKSGKDGLRYVDKELVIETARVALQAGATIASVVSAVGVAVDSPFFYNRIKGEMEQGIEQLNFETSIFWQPSVLIGERDDVRLGENIAAKCLSCALLGDYQALPGKRIAQAMAAATPDLEPGIYRYRVRAIKQFSN